MFEEHDHAAEGDPPDTRTSPGGAIFVAATVRDFAQSALRHEAVSDDVTQLQLECLQGKLDAVGLAAKLRPLLTEALAAATDADWSQIASNLIADAEELLPPGDDRTGRSGAPEPNALPA